MSYWPPLGAKTIAAWFLPHPENEHQSSVNDFWSCILAIWVSQCINHLYTMSWQPSHSKQYVTHTLPHHGIELQRSVNNIWSYILGNQGFVRINDLITELLTFFIAKNQTYNRKNTDSKIINIADCRLCKKRLLAVEYRILVIYNNPTANRRTLYKSTDRPAGRPTDNPPKSDGLGDIHQTVPELMVRVYWQPGPPIGQQFSWDPDPDPKRRSGTVAHNSCPANGNETWKEEVWWGSLRCDHLPIDDWKPPVYDDCHSGRSRICNQSSQPVNSRPKQLPYDSFQACVSVPQGHKGLATAFRMSTSEKHWNKNAHVNVMLIRTMLDYRMTTNRPVDRSTPSKERSTRDQKKKRSTAQSTTDAEYYAFAVGWMRFTQISLLLNKLCIPTIPQVVSDLQSLIASIKNTIYLETTLAHIATKYYLAADTAGDGAIDLSYLLTGEMLPDWFTNQLQKPAFLTQCTPMEVIRTTLGNGLGDGLPILGNSHANGIGPGYGIGNTVRE